MDTIEIKKSNLEAAYKQADDNTKKLPATSFGDAVKDKDDRDDRPVTERIKTFEDAMDELGYKHSLVVQYREIYDNFLDGAKASNSSAVLAYLKLRIICTALNDGWEPQFTDDELRYCPLFRLYTQAELDNMDDSIKQERQIIDTADYVTEYAGFGFLYLKDAPWEYLSDSYSRLCLQSKDLAVYCGKQFTELWADLNLIRKHQTF